MAELSCFWLCHTSLVENESSAIGSYADEEPGCPKILSASAFHRQKIPASP
ncbi:hypothetical protein OROMI_006844 [Orobanche minor]